MVVRSEVTQPGAEMGRRVVDAMSVGAGVEDGRRRWDKAHK